MNWEIFLSQGMENFFNRHLSGKLALGELTRRLEREMVRQRKNLGGEAFVPNDYKFFLNEKDYERLCSGRVQNALCEAALRKIIRDNCFMEGRLLMHMSKSAEVKQGELKLASSFAGQTAAREKPKYMSEKKEADGDGFAPAATLVLERRKIPVPLAYKTPYKLAILRGTGNASFLELGEKEIYLGRLGENDFVIPDAKASRVHAYITYERSRHVLHDAGSTNGTMVNGKKREAAILLPGDEINIGDTTLLYEAIG